ncbi:MAG: WD40 repeat domain-containing protein [Streptosporangiaceae bacterium]
MVQVSQLARGRLAGIEQRGDQGECLGHLARLVLQLRGSVRFPPHPVSFGQPLTGADGYIESVAFSPSGSLLAAGSADNTVRLWNLASLAHPVPLGGPLTGGSADKTVRLWNVTNPRRPVRVGAPLSGPTGYIYGVAFSPNGQTLAAAVTPVSTLTAGGLCHGARLAVRMRTSCRCSQVTARRTAGAKALNRRDAGLEKRTLLALLPVPWVVR